MSAIIHPHEPDWPAIDAAHEGPVFSADDRTLVTAFIAALESADRAALAPAIDAAIPPAYSSAIISAVRFSFGTADGTAYGTANLSAVRTALKATYWPAFKFSDRVADYSNWATN